MLGFSVATLSRELDARQRLVLRDKVDQARHLLGQLDDADAVRDQAFTLVELVSGRAELHLAVAAGGGATLVAFSPEATESLLRLKNDTWEVDPFSTGASGATAARCSRWRWPAPRATAARSRWC